MAGAESDASGEGARSVARESDVLLRPVLESMKRNHRGRAGRGRERDPREGGNGLGLPLRLVACKIMVGHDDKSSRFFATIPLASRR